MKNNSFKYTFYFGLIIMLVICGLITSISINVYNSINNRIKIKRQDSVIVEVPITPEKEIIHDTVIVEKIVTKPIDSSKPKKVVDTSHFNDSVIK
jgi:hypothetical protein